MELTLSNAELLTVYESLISSAQVNVDARALSLRVKKRIIQQMNPTSKLEKSFTSSVNVNGDSDNVEAYLKWYNEQRSKVNDLVRKATQTPTLKADAQAAELRLDIDAINKLSESDPDFFTPVKNVDLGLMEPIGDFMSLKPGEDVSAGAKYPKKSAPKPNMPRYGGKGHFGSKKQVYK